MEPSTVEFSSGSESGWTKYIGSPLRSEVYNHDDDKCTDFEEFGDDDDDGESDDSMASDASSGPSNPQFICVNSEGTRGDGMEHLKHAEDDGKKFLMGKRAGGQVNKSKYERRVEEQPEEEFLLEADSADSHV